MTSQPAGTGTGGKPQGPLPPLLLVLTVVTGVVDAVSILRLGRVFVAHMTGNVVFSGLALVGAPGFSLSASLAALAGFLVGALDPAVARRGHGFVNRADRLGAIGGTVRWESQPGHGTTISGSVPLV